MRTDKAMTTKEELDGYLKHLERTCCKEEILQEIAEWLCYLEFKHIPEWVVKKYLPGHKIFIVCRDMEFTEVKYFVANSWEDYINDFDSSINDWEFRQAIHNEHAIVANKFKTYKADVLTMQEFNKQLGVQEPRQMDIFDFIKGRCKGNEGYTDIRAIRRNRESSYSIKKLGYSSQKYRLCGD